MIRNLHTQKIKSAVISSSRNCTAVLEAAGITDLFDVRWMAWRHKGWG